MDFVTRGKVQPNTSQKIQICADTSSFELISEYACVNFFAHILTSLIPALTTTSFDGNTPGASPTPADKLHSELRAHIASSRQLLAVAVNVAPTRLYRSVGKHLHTKVLGDGLASYGVDTVDTME